MGDLSASIRLRPTRIALLVSPSDKESVRKFMRLCTSLWGGAYNPIIPVFKKEPKEWKSEFPSGMSGVEIARGYIDFFEPDLFIESKPKMLEKIGLGSLRKDLGIEKHVYSLDEFLAPQPHRNWSEFSAGLGIIDALRDIYSTERQFKLRDERAAVLVKPKTGSAWVEAMFGAYPEDKPSQYIQRAYSDVFKPDVIEAKPDAWRKVMLRGAESPLRTTRHKLETDRSWQHDPVIYVFKPSKNTDLIDLWNMRLEPSPVIPIPIKWWKKLVGDVNAIIGQHHRPLQGNPNGLMHRTTIEFSRSFNEEGRREAVGLLSQDLPKGSWSMKPWRNRIWERQLDNHGPRVEPLRVTAKETRTSLDIDDRDPPVAEFDSLAPDFAPLYGGGHHARWVNVVKLSYSSRHSIGMTFPFNVTDRSWPRLHWLGEPVMIGSEGWSFTQLYKENRTGIQLHSSEDVIIGHLENLGVTAELSGAGHIAKQVLHHLDGLWGSHLLADQETLTLMNNMAHGTRTRVKDQAESQELFERRSKPESDWRSLIRRRQNRGQLTEVDISDYTNRQILRLGVSTSCPHCTASNWHSLSDTDYNVVCERCLSDYPFPQGSLERGNRNWAYRVIGPFATPDFAQGSYGAILAINALKLNGPGRGAMTYSPALNLRIDGGNPCEADYVALYASESFGARRPPQLVFGEAKSFGEGDLIKDKDITQLGRIAKKFPGAVIVVSVMRSEFTTTEKRRLTKFVRHARRLNSDWEPTNPIILLTGVELFHDFSLRKTWEEKGGKHADFATYESTRSLEGLAEATQSIYLDLPRFHEDREKKRKKLLKQKRKKK